MAKVAVQGTTQGLLAEGHHFTFMEKYVLRASHPRSLFIDVVGRMWAVYFLWDQNWRAALAIFLIFRLVSFAAVWNINIKNFADTLLGKIGLLHIHPINLATQLAGSVILLYGVWQHSTDLILGGTSLVFLGHLFGWSNVDYRFSDNHNHNH